MENISAILPMRSGSQRVIGKNERLLNNKYLYEYILTSLLKTKYITNIIINTDITKVLLDYSETHRISLINRPNNLKGNCNINNVIQHTLENTNGAHFIQVHSTNPNLSANILDKSIETYFRNLDNYDSLFGVTPVQKRFWKKDGQPINHDLKQEPTTQNLEPYYEENSCLYIFSRDSFKNNNNNRIGRKPQLFEISKTDAWDIDEEDDFLIADCILKIKSK
jgi:CMP-N-acetylneuraminic acid synthetase